MDISIKKLALSAILLIALCPRLSFAQAGDGTIRTISPNVGNTSTAIIGFNRWRVGLTIYNAGPNTVYITFGPTASGATPTRTIASYTQFDMFGPAVYRGEISAIRNAGNGSLIITEYLYSN